MSDNLNETSGTLPPAVDLTPLRAHGRGPWAEVERGGGEAAGWEALARRIEAVAGPELARRAAEGGVVDLVPLLARSLRPALLAAAAAVVAAVGLSRFPAGAGGGAAGGVDGDEAAGQLVSAVQVAEALRVGPSDAVWLAEGAAPSREALAQAIGLGGTGLAGDAGSGAAEGGP